MSKTCGASIHPRTSSGFETSVTPHSGGNTWRRRHGSVLRVRSRSTTPPPTPMLRQNRGDVVKRPKAGPVQIVASGRKDCIGWVELKVEDVNEIATRMTAKVIKELNADVLGIVEAESRPSLVRFDD